MFPKYPGNGKRYSAEEREARRRRNRRSGRSETRRQRWLEEQDVEWAVAWCMAWWRWQEWKAQEEKKMWVAWQVKMEEKGRSVVEETRKWKETDAWLRREWQKAGEEIARKHRLASVVDGEAEKEQEE